MTNKLVVITNSLKVPKIKEILLYEMQFLVPNYSCFQNPWLGGYRPQIPVLSVICPQLKLLYPPSNKIPGYATDWNTPRHWTVIVSCTDWHACMENYLTLELVGGGRTYRVGWHGTTSLLTWWTWAWLLYWSRTHSNTEFVLSTDTVFVPQNFCKSGLHA